MPNRRAVGEFGEISYSIYFSSAASLKVFANVAEYRKKLGVNQQNFWPSLGVTQSGGSCYKSGRNLPKPVAVLQTLRETGKAKKADIEAALIAIQKAKDIPGRAVGHFP